MSWEPGDIALCIRDKSWLPPGVQERQPSEGCDPVIAGILHPAVGTSWRVERAGYIERPGTVDGGAVYLQLEGQPSDLCFNSCFFAKVPPQHRELCQSVALDEDCETPQPVELEPVA